MMRHFILLIYLSTLGCSTFHHDSHQTSLKRVRGRIRNLESQMNQAQLKIVSLKIENDQLREKLSAAERRKNRTELDSDTRIERMVYAKILELFRSGQLDQLEKTVQFLDKTSPLSVHMDDALYLVGELALFKGNRKKALKYFDKIIESHSMSNKVAASLYEKGLILKSMKRELDAKVMLQKIIENYPGSKESGLAAIEIQNLQRR